MSRMDRYYKVEEQTTKRTRKNEDLYKSIYDLGEYSNIEGIATIDKSNEVDITKVKNMLKNREDYQRQKEIKNFTSSPTEMPNYTVFEPEEDRVYDIRDILEKAKINKPDKEDYKSLNNINFEIIKELKEKHNKKEEDNLKELVDTISSTSKLNKLSDQELGLDMFNDLKSDNNTIIGDRNSISEILKEVKKNDEKKDVINTGMDKSFFTSSLNFGKKDFEEISEMNKTVKKKNPIIKVTIFIIILIVTALAIYLVFNLIK